MPGRDGEDAAEVARRVLQGEAVAEPPRTDTGLEEGEEADRIDEVDARQVDDDISVAVEQGVEARGDVRGTVAVDSAAKQDDGARSVGQALDRDVELHACDAVAVAPPGLRAPANLSGDLLSMIGRCYIRSGRSRRNRSTVAAAVSIGWTSVQVVLAMRRRRTGSKASVQWSPTAKPSVTVRVVQDRCRAGSTLSASPAGSRVSRSAAATMAAQVESPLTLRTDDYRRAAANH